MQIAFPEPDAPYLALAALRRYLDAAVVLNAFVVATDDGPALDVPEAALEDPVSSAIIARFGGHRDRHTPNDSSGPLMGAGRPAP